MGAPMRMNGQIERLREHFAHWEDFLDCYKYSGYAIVDRVNALAPDASIVLDAGCGFNRFKDRIPNLIGCDIVNPKADLVMDLMDLPFKEKSVDCILALGSVNFFSRDYVLGQIRFLHSLLKPGGFILFRGNPGEYGIVSKAQVALFPWSVEAITEIAVEAGFDVKTIQKDYINYDGVPEKYRKYKSPGSFRYYWEYQKR
jgi:SAM-dependent methyltransferase